MRRNRSGLPWAARIFLVALVASGVIVGAGRTRQAEAAPPAFDPGNIVVYRVGDGAAALVSTGAAVFLDEYTPTGTLVQSIALPTTVSGAQKRLIASGTATSEGLLTRSSDGRYLLLTGYDAPIPTTGLTGTSSATVARVVGRVDAAGAVDTSTGLSDFSTGNNARSAASSDGTSIWATGGAGGPRYATFGASTSTQVSTTLTNLRQAAIFDGQLYTSTASGSAVRVGTIGTGLPTTAGSTITNLAGIPPSTGSPYGIFFADLDAGVAGVDTLYVASDDANALQKFSLVAGSWALNGTVGVDDDYRGITGTVSGNTVTLFATRKGGSGATGGGELVSLVDSSGYNGAFSGTPTLLATASTNKAFRGVALAPVGSSGVGPSIGTHPASQSIASGASANLSVVATGDPTLQYQWYQGVSGVTTTPVGTNSPSYTTPNLFATTNFWVRVTNSVTSADSNTAVISIIGGGNTQPTITPADAYLSGVISDPTNPGFDFIVGDTETPVGSLTVTALSNNQAVVPNANISVSGAAALRTIALNPTGAGYADITITVTDGGSLTASATLHYAASAASLTPSTSRFPTGVADASTAIAVDANFMFVGNDEDQLLRLYSRTSSGAPVYTFDANPSLGLAPSNPETDIEAAARVGNRIYWFGSHSNSSGGGIRPNRYRIFATDISGTGASSTLSYVGRYDGLRADLIAWDQSNGHGLGANHYGLAASATSGVAPESGDGSGFNIEALEFAPGSSTTAYLGFRAPISPASARTKALIVPVTNFSSLVGGNPTAGPATFGAPIELDLGGRGIREIRKNGADDYLIAAGPAAQATGIAPADFRLYRWNGNPATAPTLLPTDLTSLVSGGSFESIVEVPNPLTNSTPVQVLSDNGDTVWYNDGTIAKELPQSAFKKFRSDLVAVGVCTATPTPIGFIQGPGTASSVQGQSRTIRGVVTGDLEGATPGFSGFYVQNQPADADGDSATSDAIFVFNGSANSVTPGQLVQVTGTVTEFSGLTELTSPTVEVCGPTGSIAATDLTLPRSSAGDLEAYEGMLVRFTQELVIAEYFNYERFGELVLALPLAGEDRPFTGTSVDAPGVAANARNTANLLSRITLDDGRNDQNPSVLRHPDGGLPFALDHAFRGGDTVADVTGVLDFRFSAYRIQPTAAATYVAVNPRPTTPPAVGGTLRAVGMNTLNFFLTLTSAGSVCSPSLAMDCRGANDATEFGRQRSKLLATILALDPDVAALMEVENTPGVEPLQDIVNGLNAATAPGTYAFIATGTIGTDAIKVGILYKPATVTPLGAFQVLDHSDDARFIDVRNRPALAQTFRQNSNNAVFTIVANHLKSKGSACTSVNAATGEFNDPDALDGQGNCNQTRTAAAQALVDWLATDPTGSGDADFLIIGDLNAYAKEDPISAILDGADDTPGTGDDYTNLILRDQGVYAYSYVFDGQAGYLDHALAIGGLASQVTGAAEWHMNSDEPDVFDYDMTFKPPSQDALFEPLPYRSSDHDPVILGLQLIGSPIVTITGGPGTTNDTMPSFTFTAEFATTIECSVDAGPFVACESPYTLAVQSEGMHTFSVRGTNASGPTTASQPFTIDITAPDSLIETTPTNPSGPSVTFGFSANEVATFECSLDGGPFAACSSPATRNNLTTGSHNFRVRGTDVAGNLESSPASFTWTVDATPPNTIITIGASGTRSSGDGAFQFTATEALSTFECRVDNAIFEVCTSPWAFTGLLNGPHTFEVRAIDRVGNTDPTPASRTWTVNDVSGPNTKILTAPPRNSASANANFTFSGRDGTTGLSFQCRLDPLPTTPWIPCPGAAGQAAYVGLSDGSHVFEVRGVDLAGNVDPRPASFSWKIDTMKPVLVATFNEVGGGSPVYVPGTWARRTVRLTITCTDPGGASASGIARNAVPQAQIYGNGVFDTGTFGNAPQSCSDRAGNVADPIGPWTVKVDSRTPTCVPTPSTTIIQRTGAMRTVIINLGVTDNLTPAFALANATIISVVGDAGTVPADIGGNSIANGVASIDVRATTGTRNVRIYTVTFGVMDEAGNPATCNARIRVTAP